MYLMEVEMGLSKQVVQKDGVPTSYHRLVRITSIVNGPTIIETESYIDRDARLKDGPVSSPVVMSELASVPVVYSMANFYQVEDGLDGASFSDVYTWLKANVPEFEGAEDVWEEGQQEVAGR